MTTFDRIKPLFVFHENPENLNADIIEFQNDNYNKEEGVSLIDAKNDG